VLRPLASTLRDPPPPVPQELVPQELVPQELVPQEPAPQKPARSVWDVAVTATSLRARLGAAAPAGLLEAVAALQDLAVRQAPAGQRASRIAELEQLQRSLPPAIMVAPNGRTWPPTSPRYAITWAASFPPRLSWPRLSWPRLSWPRLSWPRLSWHCAGAAARC